MYRTFVGHESIPLPSLMKTTEAAANSAGLELKTRSQHHQLRLHVEKRLSTGFPGWVRVHVCREKRN